MKQLKYLFPALIIGFVLSSCSTSSTSVSNGVNPSESAILWHQTSAEYDALCYQAYQAATNRIKALEMGAVEVSGDRPVAVVLDLDETVLDNSPYNAKLILEGKEYSEDSWDKWVAMEKAELIPGALEFLTYLRDNEIKYFFISNREAKHTKSTYNNLINKGIELTDKDLLLDDGTSKKDRRESISEYEIILLLGDNLADLHEDFEDKLRPKDRKERVESSVKSEMGNKYVIFPNPLYGDWKSSLEQVSKKREGQLQLLNAY